MLVAVGVEVCVDVGVTVLVAVGVGVCVDVGVTVLVAVGVAVGVGFDVGLGTGSGVRLGSGEMTVLALPSDGEVPGIDCAAWIGVGDSARLAHELSSTTRMIVSRQATVVLMIGVSLAPNDLVVRYYTSFAVSVSHNASSNSRQASSPASKVIVAPRNSNRTQRSKLSVVRGVVLSFIGCLQSGYIIKN